MRNFFLIKHHPRGLTEAYQENSCRTRAPRHTHYQRSQGAMTTRTLIALMRRIVNCQSEYNFVRSLDQKGV